MLKWYGVYEKKPRPIHLTENEKSEKSSQKNEKAVWKTYKRLHVISSNAISTTAISIVHTFNRLPFRPLANPAAENSTYLIISKAIQFFQDVRTQVIWLKNQLNVINETALRNFQRSYWTNYHIYQTWKRCFRTSPEKNQMQIASHWDKKLEVNLNFLALFKIMFHTSAWLNLLFLSITAWKTLHSLTANLSARLPVSICWGTPM